MKFISLFQLTMASIAVGFLANAWLKFLRREQQQSFFKLLASSIIWLGIAFVSLFPQSAHSLSQDLGFGESLNTLIFIGFVVVFMILFKIINMIERVERNISEMVRNETLNPLKNNCKHE